MAAGVNARNEIAGDPLLAIEGLTVSVNDHAVLDDITLDVRSGEFLAIVGESGSGKSTLVNTVLQLLPDSFTASGHVRFHGRELLGADRRQLAGIRGDRIGFVPQDPGTSLNPVRTIGYQLAEVFLLHRRELSAAEVRERSIALLQQVGIDDPERRLRQYPHQLSGGQKQRVLIAIAFALSPDLLIADEPTSALDATVQRQILEVFARLAAENGSTVLFITHDLALATDFASRLLVLKDGRVVEDDATRTVVVAPRSAYTRFLLHGVRTRDVDIPKVDTSAPAAISVDGVSKTFPVRGRRSGTVTAVDDLSFEVPAGSAFALVGASGSGKTTVARIVLGLEGASSGTVIVDGEAVNASRAGRRQKLWRHIQLVHQNPYASLNPRSSVAAIVGGPLRAHRIGTRAERANRVAELLDAVALPQRLGVRRPAELSGGQRQRVAIARALALNPKIIALDEPLSALDAVTQAQVIDLLKELQRDRGLTYLFISHDLAIVRDFADSVAVLHKGRLVETGGTGQVLVAPQAAETQALVAAEPGVRAREWLVGAGR
ncbi:dipeptide ABC transporter ATP-binding protein [Mycobacterium sp. C31M]